MTTKEIRSAIAESNNPDWFNTIETTITYKIVGFSQSLQGLSSIHKFLSQQVKGWEKYEQVPSKLSSSSQHFVKLKSQIEQFLTKHKNQSEYQLENYWKSVQSQLQSDGNRFTYDSAETQFLIDLNNSFPNYVGGAYSYLLGSFNPNTAETFSGGLLAYEFKLKDHTELTNRRNKEKASITKIKNKLKAQLSESETQLSKHLTDAKQTYRDYVDKIDDIKSEKAKSFDDWFDGNEEEKIGVKQKFKNFKEEKNNEFTDWLEGTEETIGAKKRVKDLENTYEVLLKLKKPAQYWETRAKTLKKEGWKSVKWLMLLVAIAVGSLYLLLWLTPSGMEKSFSIENGNPGSAIRWSVIYVTFISFLAYGIRVLYKIAFSAFHLSRDAEEREQLTYVYLALLNESSVDEGEKKLIMQSLFSRADTGLLKGDSSPAMPNDIVGKMFGGN